MMTDSDTTDFGYREVPTATKATLVKQVFNSVASKYDIMNDVMSLGIHRYWKRFTLALCAARPGHCVLDVAGGTGDLTYALANSVGPTGQVILADINAAMLQTGRERLIDRGMLQNISYVQADAEKLPFTDNYFDRITIAFGLRNVTDKAAALRSMYRVLKPGGQLLVLEFSQPVLPLLNKLYDLYSFNLVPKLGAWITGDSASYQYLVESIRKHPDQATLLSMLQQAGFDNTSYHNLSGGIVAVHRGYKW